MSDYQKQPVQGVGESDEQSRLAEAAKLARTGKVEAARIAFEAICTENNDCEAGWLWLASLQEDPATGLDCVREVLRINPENKTALAWLAKAQTPEQKPAARIAPKCPLCRTTWPKQDMKSCHSCHALFDLSSPAALAANQQANRKVMETALDRLRAAHDVSAFEREYYLAVALFNLLRSTEGVKQLARAAKINAADPRLAGGEIARRFSKRPVVVVADSTPSSREAIALAVERAGFSAVEADSGAASLDRVGEHKASLLLLDVAIRGIDGYSLCKKLRNDAATKLLPVVLLSTKDTMLDRAKGKMAGATDHISKPFEPNDLAQIVNKYLGGKK